MDVPFDETWAAGGCWVCDPVFEAAPHRFAERYPDSGIVASYGDGWPGVHRIDYWVYIEAEARQARLSVEGWNPGFLIVPLSGDGTQDGLPIGPWWRRS